MSRLDTDNARYEMRKVADLVEWDENPKYIKDTEYERLQEQIRHLGVYKPLLINQQDIVLGGNQRLRALRDLGVEEVMCSIVLTDNKFQMIEYALSDNDHMGTVNETKLAELVVLNPIKTELFAISPTKLKPVERIIDEHSPSADPDPPQPKEPRCRHCPLHCGMDNM